MNQNLDKLHPYPFARLNELLQDVSPETDLPLISWAMGEPKHATPDFLVAAMQDEQLIRHGFGAYPPTKGTPELRASISAFINRRFNMQQAINPESEVLPVNGTREALFAIAQTIIDTGKKSRTLMPNPFYQIYEGAALLAGSDPYFLNCTQDSGFIPDFDAVPADVWQQCQLLYLCTPGNPTGAVMSSAQLQSLIALSDEFDFVIISDECYSEIYQNEQAPPPGLLQAASEMGRHDLRNCLAFNSLSKRSNLPGLRSGYVAGDRRLIEKFLLYRTYHGSAMPMHHQTLSTIAWQDERHVIENRRLYRSKFETVSQILSPVWPVQVPEAGFYLWPKTPTSDPEFAMNLVKHANVKVLPGSFLSRDSDEGNPGTNRVRIALVATEAECADAANRIVDCWDKL
jgi:N-succinyldiaminopimelate aminotransferase